MIQKFKIGLTLRAVKFMSSYNFKYFIWNGQLYVGEDVFVGVVDS